MYSFEKIVDEFGENILFELLMGTNKACIFSCEYSSTIMNNELEYLYNDLSTFGFDSPKNLEDLLALVDPKSEILEVLGINKYLEETKNELTSFSNRISTLYLPLKYNDKKASLEVKILRIFDQNQVLFLLREMTFSKSDFESLYAESYKDKVTGLFNFNTMNLHMSLAYGRHFMGFMDLDDFKRINDTYSHLAGDELLHLIGDKLISIADNDVIFYRRSGDEFVIMTNNLDKDGAIRLAYKIMNAIKEIQFRGETIQLSFGLAGHDDNYSYSLQDTLKAADLAMYRAKGKGTGLLEVIEKDEIEEIMKNTSLDEIINECRKKRK